MQKLMQNTHLRMSFKKNLTVMFLLLFSVILFSATLLFSGCSPKQTELVNIIPAEQPSAETPSTEGSNGQKSPDYKSNSFHYQLQGASYEALKQLDVKLIVVDIDDAKLTKEQLAWLKQDGKIVLSYISIGEAENYRDYWKDNWKVGSPDFIDAENPQWKGNYKVKYWDPEWQRIMSARMQRIAEQGYSGAYLDIIDAYIYYEEKGVSDANKKMVEFVANLANSARQVNPEFLIVPQNAVELYEFAEYKHVISGFGKEDTWYKGDSVQKISDTTYALPFMDSALRDGKFILVIDYPTQQDKICDFYEKCRAKGYYCTASDRFLTRQKPLECLQTGNQQWAKSGAKMRLDGAELIYQPNTPASSQNPLLSPDGKSIAFTLFHSGYNEGPAGVYLMNSDGTNIRPLLDEPDQDSVNLPGSAWSGSRIVFSSDRPDEQFPGKKNAHELWILRIADNLLRRVTFHSGAEQYVEPSFSPDGEWIVFEVRSGIVGEKSESGSIWKIKSDGTGMKKLIYGSVAGSAGGLFDTFDARQPNWSPLGDRIVFQARESGTDDSDWNIYTMSADGSSLKKITSEKGDETDASWSPDGKWIVYSSEQDGWKAGIFAVFADGDETPKLIKITNAPEMDDTAPSWSSDGWIYFESRNDEFSGAGIWRIQALN